MFDAVCLVLFAGVFSLFMIVIPSIIEKCTTEEFKNSYINHLSKEYLHSYGK